jgi:hypothetical protein
VITVAVIGACSPKPRMMEFETVFHTTLGEELNEVGSNLPLLKMTMNEDESYLFESYIDIPDSFQIFRNKLYIADKYNRRISVFNLSMNPITNMIIPNKSADYEFGIPFQVALNKYGEIFVLASESTNSDPTNYEQYYIYKFSFEGKFIYRLGVNGINSAPMEYPDRIDIDLFDNLYVYHRDYSDDYLKWQVNRFSTSGEMNFSFNTKYISMTNQTGNKTYAGQISDVYNLKNDERMLFYMNYYLIEDDGKKIETPTDYYNSLNVYSILQNAITKNIFNSKQNIDGMLAITRDDEIVLYSYDDRNNAIRFRFINISDAQIREEFHYAPNIAEFYPSTRHFIDPSGDIYSILIKDNAHFVLIRWKKLKKLTEA